MENIDRIWCWFNSFALCTQRYPYLYNRIETSLNHPQLQGKQWIGEELSKLKIDTHFKNTAIIGGWYCHYLAYVLDPYTDYMCNYDIDPDACEISKTFNRYQEHKFTAIPKDLCLDELCESHTKYGNIELVVNTSCEHMPPMTFMRNRIESQTENLPIYILQSTDEDKYPDHINCVKDENELAEQAEIINIYYKGCKILSNGMKRFMVIGQ